MNHDNPRRSLWMMPNVKTLRDLPADPEDMQGHFVEDENTIYVYDLEMEHWYNMGRQPRFVMGCDAKTGENVYLSRDNPGTVCKYDPKDFPPDIWVPEKP
jgi:hypothetical protein